MFLWSLQNHSEVAYGLQLSPSSKVQPIFHVSLFQLAKGDFSTSVPPTLPIIVDWELLVGKRELAHRWSHVYGSPMLELLIQWMHQPYKEAS